VFEVDPQTLSRQSGRLKRIKEERNNSRVKSALEAVKKAAAESKNVMPCILDAVRSYATVGEIVSKLKGVYGEAEQASIF
jgi:methylmalonyl-CoA mutase N-terminal domain/subunit